MSFAKADHCRARHHMAARELGLLATSKALCDFTPHGATHDAQSKRGIRRSRSAKTTTDRRWLMRSGQLRDFLTLTAGTRRPRSGHGALAHAGQIIEAKCLRG
jgi:hypothetical protein